MEGEPYVFCERKLKKILQGQKKKKKKNKKPQTSQTMSFSSAGLRTQGADESSGQPAVKVLILISYFKTKQ